MLGYVRKSLLDDADGICEKVCAKNWSLKHRDHVKKY